MKANYLGNFYQNYFSLLVVFPGVQKHALRIWQHLEAELRNLGMTGLYQPLHNTGVPY